MKSLLWLTESILRESGMRCGADPSRDILTVARRTENEGESFLTITLPAFGASFDQALASGKLEPTMTPAFRWHRRGLPEFLRGFLLQVFSPDGTLLSSPSHEAISCIRQICLLQKKVLRPCTKEREDAALLGYEECENELARPAAAEAGLVRTFASVASVVWTNILGSFDYMDPYDVLRPGHGPGATRERVHGNAKYKFPTWYSRLESEFPFTEFAVSTLRNLGEEDCPLSRVQFIEPEDEEPVRVIFVPKTQKTPRVIAIEPICMQYMQQALVKMLVPLIESGRYTGGRVNFSDQSVNGRLALAASISGRMATLDLSEASDRVSLDLVNIMLQSAPRFRDQVMACRSTRAELLNGKVLTLNKFASMGSAMCFPIEAMMFFCIIVATRLHRLNVPVTAAAVHKYSRDVYVYGDDIIVPADEAPVVCDGLESFRLKVNRRKSFWTGLFRESCGTDAYGGTDVTPTYVRHEEPSAKRDAEALVSWVAFANQLYVKGYWQTARRVREKIERILGPLPVLDTRASGLCWVTYSGKTEHKRWNRDLMRFENRAWVPTPKRRADTLTGDGALLKCFSVIGQAFAVAQDHLEQTVVRGRLALKSRWVPA